MTEDPFWKNIPPEYIWLACDFHGMTAVYTHKPIYMEKAFRWGLPSSVGKRQDGSLIQEPPREKAYSTLQIRPGYDIATERPIEVAPLAPTPVTPAKTDVNFMQVVGETRDKIESVLTTTNVNDGTWTVAQPAGGIGIDQLSVLKDMADLLEPILGSLLAISVAVAADLGKPSSLMRQIVSLSDKLACIKNSIEVLRKVQNGKAP
jgi:hypothetical protein